MGADMAQRVTGIDYAEAIQLVDDLIDLDAYTTEQAEMLLYVRECLVLYLGVSDGVGSTAGRLARQPEQH